MINADILKELEFLLHSFVLGVFIMIAYDVLRIFRRLCKHSFVVIAIEDLLYWMACAVCIFLMLYQENSGSIRWFAVAGVSAGMLLYNGTISMHLTDKIADVLLFLWNHLKHILKVLFHPVLFLLSKLFQGSKFLEKKGKKLCIFQKKQLKKVLKRVKMILSKY